MWGIDQLLGSELSKTRRRLRNSNVALLSQRAAVDHLGRPTLEALMSLGIHPLRVFGPEHGYNGVAQAEESVSPEAGAAGITAGAAEAPTLEADDCGDEQFDEETTGRHDQPRPRPDFVSLYGSAADTLSPRRDHFEGIDVLVIDVLDVGSRYYTYLWTALLAARAAEAAGVHTLVLDRPNPLSGDPSLAEGAPQQPEFRSFVGLEPIPVRHGLTVGEALAHFFARADKPLGPNGALSVVPCLGWERLRTAQAWPTPFVAPSPNMPTLEAALVYPGGCLLEGTNLSEGRGTTQPFQAVGAPFLDGEALARAVREQNLPGWLVRPHSFRPTFSKHAGSLCHGVAVHVTDPARFRPVAAYLSLIALARQQAPDQFEFLQRPYEFETDKLAFDLLSGSTLARELILAGADLPELKHLADAVPESWSDHLREAEQLAAQASG